jgi:hypothetical protein
VNPHKSHLSRAFPGQFEPEYCGGGDDETRHHLGDEERASRGHRRLEGGRGMPAGLAEITVEGEALPRHSRSGQHA